ncbi:LysR substrate-binding domain-containing protein [Aeromonas taiwanensis]|uniref:LysR substrate-binding domain-containing protein n=1 Tax=Aeromonas taiwanensis TaxID=633417 RepID=UPI00248DD9D9|nr:LysR substrate-binding domain-containing protein [Aeromonas taiwanensis]
MPPRVRIPVSPPFIPFKPASVAGLSFEAYASPYFGSYSCFKKRKSPPFFFAHRDPSWCGFYCPPQSIEPSGLIRINSSRIAARLLIEPHMGEFLARHPKLRLELVMADGFSNIIADGMDAGIRLGESLDEHVVAVPITPPLTMAIVGSPDYFRQHGTPQTPGDLTRHNCLAYRFTSSNTIDRWSFTSPDEEQHTQIFDPKGNAVFNDDDSMLQAALQGVGLVKHLDLRVRQHLSDGSLERVLAHWCPPFPGFYLYVPSRAQMPAKIRALMDFLVEKREGVAR